MATGEVKLSKLGTQKIIALYENTYEDIVKTITDASLAGKIQKAKVMATIRAQLTELGVDIDVWATKTISQRYLDGANQAVQGLRDQGVDISSTGLAAVNRESIAYLVDDTRNAFADSLTTIARKAQGVVSDVAKQQISTTLAEGRLTGAARKTITSGVVQDLENNGLSALVDAGGKQWSFEAYADMLVRTKAVEARNTGLKDKMLQNGYDLVQVSDHNSDHPACADWEGEILSISGNTPGYPTTDDAEADGLMHPNCEHAYDVIEPDLADQTEAYDNPFNED